MASPRSAFMLRVARRIADARAARGLTQEGLASGLDIATKNVQRLESGAQNLTLETLERVAGVLGLEPEALVSGRSAERATSSRATVRPQASSRGTDDARALLADLAARGFEVRAATARGRRPTRAVPILLLTVAAGRASARPRLAEAVGWVTLDGGRPAKAPEGQFAAVVRGDSMSPRIPDGALVLFGPARAGDLTGRVFLLEHAELADPAVGGPLVLKRIARVATREDGSRRITLRSDNRTYPDRVVVVHGDDDLRVIAEFVRVLEDES